MINRIPWKVTSSKPDLEDDITLEPSLSTTSGTDSSFVTRLSILFLSSTTSSSGDEVLHGPDLSEDLAVRLSFSVYVVFLFTSAHTLLVSPFGTILR